jgi:copper transport protein
MFLRQLRNLLLLLAPALLAVTLAAPTAAHSNIERSDPPEDAVLPTAPDAVHIWFTQELFRREGENQIEVQGPDGARVDAQDVQIDDDDRKHLFVSLAGDLLPGLYTVSWRALSSEDGHPQQGEFTFTVGETTAAITQTSTQTGTQMVETEASTSTATVTSMVGLTATAAATGATSAPVTETVTEASPTATPAEAAQEPTPTVAQEEDTEEAGGGLPCLGSTGLGFAVLALAFAGQKRALWRR